MRPGKCIARVLEMVKLCVEPRIHGVTGFAPCGEACCHVIEHLRLEVRLVTGVASRREAGELACSRVFVALVALQQSVGPYQREPVLVIADLRQRFLPTLH